MALFDCGKPKAEKTNGQDKNIDRHAEVKFNTLQHFYQKHAYTFGFVRDKDGELYLNNTK
ncbi:restriction endonuclease subunit R [Aggregatibacter actinomycetemcomitans]|uniref:restriction endonuclease subunit R n=1 Tax=Aggregatibacter actinomycetemcomitans TaxID=714 RepID=UPI001E29A791|nr:restriction endonuclease subunit R [Aggregatibacter actinomycetemcomitans]